MKQSIYNRTVKLDGNLFAVYNTLTGALCIFEKDEYEHFFLNDIKNLNPDELKDMNEKTFFVSDDTDELSMVLAKRSYQISNPTIPTYRILVTTACNARCSYCFEKGINFMNMDMRVANAVIDFILRESVGVSNIKVQWFGGEPLLNLDIIKYITHTLNTRFKGDIVYSMISNGSLLTKTTIQELLELGVKKIQITLDGDKVVYEKRKNYVNKNITFETIINNISLALEKGLFIVVRLNYDKSTVNNIKQLIEYLGEKFKNYKNFSCYPYPIYGTYNGFSSQGTRKVELLELHNKIINAGIINIDKLFRSILAVKNGPCMAYSKKSFFISPCGDLFKCSIDMKNSVGNVFDGPVHNSNFFKWYNIDLNQKCRTCDLLPICQGGCRAGALGKLPVTCMRDKDIVDDIIKLLVASYKTNTRTEGYK